MSPIRSSKPPISPLSNFCFRIRMSAALIAQQLRNNRLKRFQCN